MQGSASCGEALAEALPRLAMLAELSLRDAAYEIAPAALLTAAAGLTGITRLDLSRTLLDGAVSMLCV